MVILYSCNEHIPIKEELYMPRRDGTGPEGKGPGTGRGLGNCKKDNTTNGLGLGRRCQGHGKGNGCGRNCKRNNF